MQNTYYLLCVGVFGGLFLLPEMVKGVVFSDNLEVTTRRPVYG
jgi:hypothetical protein